MTSISTQKEGRKEAWRRLRNAGRVNLEDGGGRRLASRPFRKHELRALAGLVRADVPEDATVADIRAHILHAIGKLAVPDGADAQDPFNAMEWEFIFDHLDALESEPMPGGDPVETHQGGEQQ